MGGEATEANFVNWLIAKAGTGPGGEEAEEALAKDAPKKRRRESRGVTGTSLDADFKKQFLLRVQDGRLEPLLNVREQAVEVAALKDKLVQDGHSATAVSSKVRAFIATLRIFWRVGVYHHRGSEETAGDGQKLQLWGWAPGRTAHPYVQAHAEVLDIRLKTTSAGKYPTHAEKEAALKAVPNLTLHDLPTSKAECLQGEAREAMGESPLF